MKALLTALSLLTLLTLPGCSDPAERLVSAMEQLATIADENKDDCDAMAKALEEFGVAHGAEMKALQADLKGKAPDEAGQAKYAARMKAATEKMYPAQMQCASHEGVQKAMKTVWGNP